MRRPKDCRPHSQKSSTVEIANIEMKTGEGYLLDGCRAWRCELVATGIVEARKGEPMSDLISRADAISVLDNFTQTDTLGHTPRQIVEALPTIEPRAKSKWWHYEDILQCCNCSAEFYDDIVEYTGDDVPKFCPNCGADMRGEEE